MIDATQLRKIFNDKLAQTDSMDAAFRKAVWVAYQQGLKDASGPRYQPDATLPHAKEPV